jgi:chromosome segregation ATPase
MEIASAPTEQIDHKAVNRKLVNEINEQKTKHTADLIALRKELRAAHEAVTLLQAAVDGKGRQLQERTTEAQGLRATIESLQAENADLRRRLKACDNVHRLILEAARGGTID